MKSSAVHLAPTEEKSPGARAIESLDGAEALPAPLKAWRGPGLPRPFGPGANGATTPRRAGQVTRVSFVTVAACQHKRDDHADDITRPEYVIACHVILSGNTVGERVPHRRPCQTLAVRVRDASSDVRGGRSTRAPHTLTHRVNVGQGVSYLAVTLVGKCHDGRDFLSRQRVKDVLSNLTRQNPRLALLGHVASVCRAEKRSHTLCTLERAVLAVQGKSNVLGSVHVTLRKNTLRRRVSGRCVLLVCLTFGHTLSIATCHAHATRMTRPIQYPYMSCWTCRVTHRAHVATRRLDSESNTYDTTRSLDSESNVSSPPRPPPAPSHGGWVEFW